MDFTLGQLAGNRLLLRFLERVDPAAPNGCWQWTDTLLNGYGRMNRPNRGGSALAHRIAYEIFKGPIPPRMQIDHLCRNRGCVNPAHLEAVTIQENLRRGEGVAVQNSRKTHCPKGHPYAGENLMIVRDGKGYISRRCRSCDRERVRLHHARKRAERMARPSS